MPSSTIIFGGHGKCAQHVTVLLVKAGHTVTSVIRNAEQIAELKQLGAHPVVQDIASASVGDMAATVRAAKADTVVWAAAASYGGTPEQILAVDAEGAIRTMDAAAEAGAKRYLSISALDIRDREKVPWPPWYNDEDKDISRRVYGAIKTYLDAKFVADKSLVTENGRRGLKYTIVRPNGLTDDSGTGFIEAGKVNLGKMVSREDVASVVVECIKNDETQGLVFDVVGGMTKVTDAVATVARNREDTFDGMY